MAKVAGLAHNHHLVVNRTDVLVFWNLYSWNIAKYMIKGNEDNEILYFLSFTAWNYEK